MEQTDTISSALDQAFDALREGRYPDLEGAAAELEAAIDALSAIDPGSLAALRRKAERNAACLQGAIRGIRAARRRVAEVMELQGGQGTYDSRGQRDVPRLATSRLSTRL